VRGFRDALILIRGAGVRIAFKTDEGEPYSQFCGKIFVGMLTHSIPGAEALRGWLPAVRDARRLRINRRQSLELAAMCELRS